MLVTDQSGSMAATDVPPTRLDAARRAANDFLDRVPERVQVGAIVYNQSARVIAVADAATASGSRSALAEIEPAGSTATGDALTLASRPRSRRRAAGRKPPPAAIVLLSDGKSVRGSRPGRRRAGGRRRRRSRSTPSRWARRRGRSRARTAAPCRSRPTRTRCARIAEISDGRAVRGRGRRAGSSTVYERLGRQLTRKKEQRQITAGFAGGGLALILVGAGMSLFLFGRVP